MLSALCLHGVLLVLLTGLYNRWLDDELTADICLVALLVELLGVLFAARYSAVTDAMALAHLGSVRAPWVGLELRCTLAFDEISGVFFGILAAALVVCFFFLAEYFDYDSGAGVIAWLSALFSQVAMLYFCAFDTLTLLLG